MVARAQRVGVKSHALAGGACGLLLAAWLGCGPPTVAARAVWIAAARGPGGERTLSIYDAGAASERVLRPAAAEAEGDGLPLIVELDPRGQGALVRAGGGGWQHELGDSSGILRAGYLDLEGGRTLPLALPAGRAPDAFAFAAGGGALWWTDGCPAELRVVPLSPRVAPPRAADGAVAPLAWPLGGGCAERWGALGAGDAPVLFAVESVPEDGALRPGTKGHVLAIRYPLPDSGADEAPALALVRAGELPATDLVRLSRARCAAPGPSCGLGVVDPEGEALAVAALSGACRIWRWSALDGSTVCAVPASAPAALQPWTLVAAISPRRFVFRDGLVVHLHDWVSGALESRPLLGDTSELFTSVVDGGRAVVFVSIRGVMLRASEEGLDLLSVEQRACPGFQAPVVAPAGRFAAFTCVQDGLDGDDGLVAGDVVRVSAGGMERFQGVPMWALAIDDAGDLLLHSRGTQDFSFELLLPPDPPRNLYVLSGDGELAHVETLEPDPELLRGAAPGVYRWISAQPLGGPG